ELGRRQCRFPSVLRIWSWNTLSRPRFTKMSGEEVLIPDDIAFSNFKSECNSDEGWSLTYNKSGITVWIQILEEEKSLHKIKMPTILSVFYSAFHSLPSPVEGKCPKPLRNRDVITLRSWLPIGNDYIIMNYSVKHPKYPPKKDMVRAVSIQTGYLIQSNGPSSCTLTYLAQVDPRGSLPRWVVNKSSQFLAPKAMKRIGKACLKYAEWKLRHSPGYKPWLYPEQSPLVTIPLSELSVQHADSLENIDESSLSEGKDDRAEHSDEDAPN
ncbi:hypothetical protein P4O66_017879, partial [Electrophorus voltai]